MAKRKVKRKAPKRKRKVAKRKVVKRKASKRRRKRKFGMGSMAAKLKEKAEAAAKAVKEKAAAEGNKAKTTFIKLGGGQILKMLSSKGIEKDGTQIVKGLAVFNQDNIKLEGKKADIAKVILGKMDKDCSKGDVNLTNTIAYFKDTAKEQGENAKLKMEELKGALYAMLKEKQIYEKAKEKWKEVLEKIPDSVKTGLTVLNIKITEYSQFTNFIKNLYKSQTDATKKVAFNLLGSLLTNTDTDEGKVFKDGEEGKHGLINDLKAAGTEAIKTATDPKKTEFGKRKKGPSASLKKLCKKHGVRLTVKRGKKRVYKSSKVLKEQCQRKLKKNKKKNFGQKKIKRSSIMPPKRRTPKTRKVTKKGKKKSPKRKSGTKGKKYPKTFKRLMEKMYRGVEKRSRPITSYIKKNPRKSAAAAAAGVGYAGLEGYLAAKRRGLEKGRTFTGPEGLKEALEFEKFKRTNPYASPTGRAYRGAKGYARRGYDAATTANYRSWPRRGWDATKAAPGAAWSGAKGYAGRAKKKASSGMEYLRSLFKRGEKEDGTGGVPLDFGKRKRRRRRSSYKFGDNCSTHKKTAYGKRKRRRRSFGKKAKKPSAATRRMCKKLKVRLTIKRGGKRVYKSEAMLKKQCKKAMKRKKKK